MTNTKPNNVFAERDALLRENERLRREYNRLSNQTKWIEAQEEAARKVADAAVAVYVVKGAMWRLSVTSSPGVPAYRDARDILHEAKNAAAFALEAAVREYRARAEANGMEAEDARATL